MPSSENFLEAARNITDISFRAVYFFVQHSQLPFKVGAIFQLSVDFG